jgi:hypothetical protein|uniref:Uncharacterized protein n=1 Tax=Siphoviridae sp. ctAjZ17 TaxID=2827797 RepID=A0A8S5SNE6_9CAUD|nr:MAG TPA: protein of unknown function (DUF4428) [Siphoviridae sp. ctAjZ17]
MITIIQCEGEGEGNCKGCDSKGIWNRYRMNSLYKIKGQEGYYCEECIKEIMRKEEREWLNMRKITAKKLKRHVKHAERMITVSAIAKDFW